MKTEDTNKRIDWLDDIVSDKTKRVVAGGEDFQFFMEYYFSQFISYRTPDFHKDMFKDIYDMVNGNIDEAVWMMFRESAKTSIAKIFVVWCICYKKKRFINYDCNDKSNAEQALFDVTVWLQTNTRLIEDFGHLYYEDEMKSKKIKEMKRINEFITANGVKVKAYSTQVSTRGRIYDRYRPDLYVVDDFETSITKRSILKTKAIIDHIDEMKSGLGNGGNILYLCNYISETGSVAHILEQARNNKRVRVRDIPIMDKKTGEIAWKDKYVLTEKQALELNKNIMSIDKKKISIESKREQLGEEVFQTEMMNNPSASSEMVFDRTKIDELLKQTRSPEREVAGFKLWDKYNPKHRYAIAGDGAEGVGRDSSATALIDFSTVPNRVIGTYKNNQIAPDVFAYEMKRQGDMFGECLLAPERNNPGNAIIAILKTIYPIGKIYRMEQKDKLGKVVTKQLGFHTNGATKPSIIYNLKSAIEDGELVTFDEELLREMRAYVLDDLKQVEYAEGMTRHFDLLMATAIAWEMRHHAKIKQEDKPFVQPKWEPMSNYEG